MKEKTHIPDSEFTIMQIVWTHPQPISKIKVAVLAEAQKGWTPQTVYTLLYRLTEKGFLSSEKQGKKRYYSPLVSRETYIDQETDRFMKLVHNNSLTELMNALFKNKPTRENLAEIEHWLKKNIN